MYKSIETLLLTEFAVDLTALFTALRPCSRIYPMRLFFAAILGSILTCACTLHELPVYITSLTALLSLPFLIRIAAGRMNIRKLFGSSVSFIFVSTVISAFSALLPLPAFVEIPLAAMFALLLLGCKRKWLEIWEVPVTVQHNGKTTSFTALIDTGNRLIEPFSNLPVLIVESELIRRICADNESNIPARKVPYGGIGGTGLLECFMPDCMYIEYGDKQILVNDVWIAVYPGKMPGSQRALAPAYMALAL